MDFNCSNCPQKDNASYPSIVVSIIDEFNGIVYGKFCSYDCASKDTASYFTAAAIGDYESIVSTQIPSHYIKQVPIIKQTDVEAITWEIDMIRFLFNPNEFIEDNLDSSSIDILMRDSILEHVEDLNKLWLTLKKDSKKIMQCALLLYWITCRNGINENVETIEDLLSINKKSWVEFKNGYSFVGDKAGNGIHTITVSYNGDKFIISETDNIGTSSNEVEEDSIIFKKPKSAILV